MGKIKSFEYLKVWQMGKDLKELGFFENKDNKETLQKIEGLLVKINNLIESTRKRAKQQ
jgi:hypothetical protein